MKPTALLINIGRAAIVDEEALYAALRDKQDRRRGARCLVALSDAGRAERRPSRPAVSRIAERADDAALLERHRRRRADRRWGAVAANLDRYVRGESLDQCGDDDLRRRPMADDIAFLPATRLLNSYRAKELSPVEVIEADAAPARTLRGRAQRLCALRPGERTGGGARVGGALAEGRAAGHARRRSAGDQGHAADARLAAPRRLEDDRPEPGLERGRAGDRSAAARRTRCSSARRRRRNSAGSRPPNSPLSGITRNPWNLERTPGGRAAAAPRRWLPASARWRSAPMPAARSASRRRSAACSD